MRSAISRCVAASARSGWINAIGWMPIVLVMMNSSRARPTPSTGREESPKACSGLPTFTKICVRVFGRSWTSSSLRWKGRMPSITTPVSPSAHDTVTGSPLFRTAVACAVPTTHGMPSSRDTIAA